MRDLLAETAGPGAALSRQDRRQLDRMAGAAGVSVEALLPAVIAAYLRLMRDAPAVLPADPLRGLQARARHGGGA